MPRDKYSNKAVPACLFNFPQVTNHCSAGYLEWRVAVAHICDLVEY